MQTATPKYMHILLIKSSIFCAYLRLFFLCCTPCSKGVIFLNIFVFDKSQSSGDSALCCYLAFWTGKDAGRIDALFRQSALFRPKWDEKHGKSTYGSMTIEKAVAKTSSIYQPKQPETSDSTQSPALMNISREKIEEALHTDEAGDAKLFSQIADGKRLYNHTQKTWMKYGKGVWEQDQVKQTRINIKSSLIKVYGNAVKKQTCRIAQIEKDILSAAGNKTKKKKLEDEKKN